jgi:hypothetical protein
MHKRQVVTQAGPQEPQRPECATCPYRRQEPADAQARGLQRYLAAQDRALLRTMARTLDQYADILERLTQGGRDEPPV